MTTSEQRRLTHGRAPFHVLLPVAAATWSDERLLAVFVHEMAHIRRRDWALHTRTKSTCVTKPP